jgi:CBS domain-containing protein
MGRGERTVKKLRLSKALTIPEGTTVSDACRRMAARRVDAVLLTDAQGLLSGIVTDKVGFLLYFLGLNLMVTMCVRYSVVPFYSHSELRER